MKALRHPTYAKLFLAQVVALVGTGLLTVALGLLAFELAGDAAGGVLGAAFAIKMIAYVAVAPVANALVERIPLKPVLICADIVRLLVALMLPFVSEVWQIFALIFVLQASSATFTPAFQAAIPEILTDEDDYTQALSLSRLAYDLESLLSPALAAVLLGIMSFHWLFAGTALGFAFSCCLVLWAALPARRLSERAKPFLDRLTRGSRIYLSTPRLRGLLALNLAAAAAGAFVLVNTVVMVLSRYGGNETDVAIALGAFGGGSMSAALLLPAILKRTGDRSVMLVSGVVLTLLMLGHGELLASYGVLDWPIFLFVWALSGAAYASVLTPAGRLLRISSGASDRPALFAAQFALSHACWLMTYPAAGWLGQFLGLGPAMLLLGLLALAGTSIAVLVWRPEPADGVLHEHPELPADHPHLVAHGGHGDHRHALIFDEYHSAWPSRIG